MNYYQSNKFSQKNPKRLSKKNLAIASSVLADLEDSNFNATSSFALRKEVSDRVRSEMGPIISIIFFGAFRQIVEAILEWINSNIPEG